MQFVSGWMVGVPLLILTGLWLWFVLTTVDGQGSPGSDDDERDGGGFRE